MLGYMAFPAQHRAKLHSTNPLERLNKEIKRRADVVGIFPNEATIVLLISAVLLEQNEEWQLQHRYMQLEAMAEARTAGRQPRATPPSSPGGLTHGHLNPPPNLHQLDGRDQGAFENLVDHAVVSFVFGQPLAAAGERERAIVVLQTSAEASGGLGHAEQASLAEQLIGQLT